MSVAWRRSKMLGAGLKRVLYELDNKPFVLPAISLATGIGIERLCWPSPWSLIISIVGTCVSTGLVIKQRTKLQISEKKFNKFHLSAPLAWMGLLFFIGIFLCRLELQRITHVPPELLQKPILANGVVERTLGKTGKSVIVRLTGVTQQNITYATTGKVLVKLSNDGVQEVLVGQGLQFAVRLRPLDSTLSPKFLAFLKQQNVEANGTAYYQDDFPEVADYIRLIISKIRNKLIEYTGQLHLRPDISAMTNALIWGWRVELPEGTSEIYADAGVAHLLALSGLQLTYIYLLISGFLLGIAEFVYWANGYVVRRRFRLWTVVFALPIYAVLSGGSAAVIRALFMAEIFLFATLFKKQHNIFNILAFTAFVLLLYQPSWLVDIGFQLTYGALLGLVWVMSLVDEIWPVNIPHWLPRALVRFARGILLGSLAAQLFVSPVVICHFDTFPTYFIVANFVAIPLSGAMTMLGFVGLLFAEVPVIGDGIAAWIDVLGSWQQAAIYAIARWPGAIIDLGEWKLMVNLGIAILISGLLWWLYGLRDKKRQRTIEALEESEK